MLNTLTRASVTTARDFIRMLMDVPDTIAYRRLLLAQTTDIMIDASVAEATRAQSASAPNRKPDSTGISMAMMPGNTRLLNRPLSKIPVSNPPFSVLPAFFQSRIQEREQDSQQSAGHDPGLQEIRLGQMSVIRK